ncbi:uncharacterized protein A4U43_C02F770 [Asparagus officinalis]|uniref:Uncharacterized protein n=1 Tax=Asparagus officinalis TaxID=4686 RepID=A0A5P1FET0_ASPOF|nr:uncharacterized protein A4U43_C02F770 [Asparagus officinalis]
MREKGKEWKEIEDLPWKGEQQGRNLDYKILRAERRKMAPVNGWTVLLFSREVRVPASKDGGLEAEEGVEAELEARHILQALAPRVSALAGAKSRDSEEEEEEGGEKGERVGG